MVKFWDYDAVMASSITIRKLFCSSSLCTLFMVFAISPSWAVSLKNAVSVAIDSNPEVGEAIESREAIEFELRQAKGLLLPSIDLEASAGTRRLDNPSRRALRIDDDSLSPVEIGVVATQKLFDGGRIRGEIDRQASRIDSASFRVLERSEYIALQVTREYLESMLQAQVITETVENLEFHRKIAANISSGIAGGALTEADRQQADERVLASKAKLTEAEEDYAAGKIRFYKLTGIPLTGAKLPASVTAKLPKSLSEAIGLGRTNNPRIHMANADIDAADALLDATRAELLPEVFLEGRARTGNDLDVAEGRTTDLQARVVLQWNLYRGGIKKANVQEHVRRVSEQRMIRHNVQREIEEAVRTSWTRRLKQAKLAVTLQEQASQNKRLVNTYQEQFAVGQRSLLDVLDAQNTRYNVDILARTAKFASIFAEYRLLAATGTLLNTFNLQPARQSEAYARAEFNVPETLPAEIDKRVVSRQTNDLPMDLLAPIRRQ